MTRSIWKTDWQKTPLFWILSGEKDNSYNETDNIYINKILRRVRLSIITVQKLISITYSKYVFVALVIQHAERMHPPSATCLAHFTFTHKRRDFQENIITHKKRRGARCWWRIWLRHCATSLKVAGPIPDGVNGIFHWHNPSDHTMALGLTQTLTEMSSRNISWGVKAAGA